MWKESNHEEWSKSTPFISNKSTYLKNSVSIHKYACKTIVIISKKQVIKLTDHLAPTI